MSIVRVHRNLHQAKAGGPQWVVTDSAGRVIERHHRMVLHDVQTMVQPAGVRACQRDQVRNVCARFKGRWSLAEVAFVPADLTSVRCVFDPRVHDAFMFERDGQLLPWTRADAVLLWSNGTCDLVNPRGE